MFLQPMLSATISKSIFDFRICIPSKYIQIIISDIALVKDFKAVWDTCKLIFADVQFKNYWDELKLHWHDKSLVKSFMQQMKTDLQSVKTRFYECLNTMTLKANDWIWEPTAFSAGWELNMGKYCIHIEHIAGYSHILTLYWTRVPGG